VREISVAEQRYQAVLADGSHRPASVGLRHHDPVVALAKALQDRRAAVAACTAAGVFPLAHWVTADMSRGETSQQHQWFFVLLFSAVLLAMGLGMLAIASQIAGPAATRAAVLLGVVLAAASLTNIVEDGLKVEPHSWCSLRSSRYCFSAVSRCRC
jgi:hypothetical protein